jgi:alkanesulfonate monooxygenase SsuD/methylene tetrahydromethanopterin reductase-like flavin-dependent oxidoreductase (luciferase family)
MPTSGEGAVLDKPFPEAWTLLSALAARSERMRVAVLVSGNTYRHPVLLAKQAVTLDHITAGRVELGVGAGWYEAEHRKFGWDFPPAGTRVDMLEESLQVIRSLLTERRTTFYGKHYALDDAPFQPKPVQERLPLMIGGQKRRMMALVARYADIWSIDQGPDEMRASGILLEAACADIGRDHNEIRRSAFVVSRRAGREPWDSLDAFLGVLNSYSDAGANEVYFKMPDESQWDLLHEIGKRLPELRANY